MAGELEMDGKKERDDCTHRLYCNEIPLGLCDVNAVFYIENLYE